ncbi:LysR family transcriptional regulator [uncultured Desulfosarcina sp.]|uniref:LysR family transcriptional regulator n=1 Tax=uncultured Desulfosarcina sp. TaxID=218289 RepID=UPI0029C6AE8E|nr:LysR family transcriptional regulator [uncultured Desulfosarcina sp.]
MNHLEIKHLRMLCAIAATGNMTRAAGTLCISQSALSQQLKDIEGRLKVDLFFRTHKRMLLTPIGKRLLNTARDVVGAIEEAELEIARIAGGDRGELKVGTQCLFCFKWLPGVMRTFQKKFPNIIFEIGNSDNLSRELEAKRYDLIITAAPVADDYDSVGLFDDQMVCIMPEDLPLSARPFVRFEDFTGFNLIAHVDRGQHGFYQRVLKPKGIEPQRFMAVGQPEAIVEMVASGFGISVSPRWAVARALAANGIVARPIGKNGFTLTYRAAFLKKRQIPIFQQEFINIVKKADITGHVVPAENRIAGI